MQDENIAIVKSTVPLIQQSGELITAEFYRLLFIENPDFKHVFNMANQANGRQKSTLAAAILGYAANIDNLAGLKGTVENIAAKHFSLDIAPDQYDAVGRNLLIAIRNVLGSEIATDTVIAAWADAYGQLAEILIYREQQLYQQANERGWDGFKPFLVDRIVAESDEVRSFYLKPVDGKPLPSYLPGQFISLKIKKTGWDYDEIRQYSLSDKHEVARYRISVKREQASEPACPDGKVSNYLHEEVQEGDQLSVHMPAGNFYLNDGQDPVVLISGGVGITPLLSMLNHMVHQQDSREIVWIHGARNFRAHSFRQHVAELAARWPKLTTICCYDDVSGAEYLPDHQGRITRELLAQYCTTDSDFYFCGPVPFMRYVHSQLTQLGVAPERLHYEVFGPSEALS